MTKSFATSRHLAIHPDCGQSSRALVAVRIAVTTLLLLAHGVTAAQGTLTKALPTANQELQTIQSAWASIKYGASTDRQDIATLIELESRSAVAVAAHPDDAALKIWRGIVLATMAGEDGGLGALGLVKEAKQLFEAAIKVDPGALDGSAYTSLGSLYYQVPGWPIAFGSDKKAKRYLEQGLAINPTGIDSNYFMAEFWFEAGDYARAEAFLDTATAAPARPDRPIADAGRHRDIEQLRARIHAEQE